MSQKPGSTPLAMPPHIDFAKLLVRICSLQREIRMLLAVLAKKPSESQHGAKELAQKKQQLAEYQRELPRTLRNTVEKILDGGRDALGHHLMPKLLQIMHADKPNDDFAPRAARALAKLRALETPGTEIIFVQPYRDTCGYNQYSDLIHYGVMATRGLTIDVEPEYPYQTSAPRLRFRRYITRVVSEHAKAGRGDQEEVVFEFHTSTDPGDGMPKFLEGLAECSGEDVTRFHIGTEAVDAFLRTDYMRKHPHSLALLTGYRNQDGTS